MKLQQKRPAHLSGPTGVIPAYLVATQKYIEKLKQEKEAEQQRKREEAANNAADI